MELLNWGNFWQWGRLKPWQMLHSKLADISADHASGDMELWQLLQHSDIGNNRGGGEEDEVCRDGFGMEFEDLETVEWMWRYGGVKLSEWLASRQEAAEEEEEERRSHGHDVGSESVAGYGEGEARGGGSEDVWYVEEDGGEEDEVRLAVAAPSDLETRYYWGEGDRASLKVEVEEEEKEEEGEVCAVCLEDLVSKEEEIARLECRHNFHRLCLMPWLQQRTRCPCCRAPVDPPPPPPPDLAPAATLPLDLLGLMDEMEAALDQFGLLLF